MAPNGRGATPLFNDFDYRDNVVCFTPGILIETSNGEVPVECFRPGDILKTTDNGFQPVRWVGSRSLTSPELEQRPNLRPIVICKGAFGNRRKMLVAPQHGNMAKHFGDNRLIRAKHAAEVLGGTFTWLDKKRTSVTYIHIIFNRHQIVVAERMETEAFFPGPMALRSICRPALFELLALVPELESVASGKSNPRQRYREPARDYILRKDALLKETRKSAECLN